MAGMNRSLGRRQQNSVRGIKPAREMPNFQKLISEANANFKKGKIKAYGGIDTTKLILPDEPPQT
jgi:hypothetical protein